MPMAIRSARRGLRNRELQRILQPKIDDLKRRHKKNPEKMLSELKKLYATHEFTPLDGKVILPILIQLPIGIMLYRSIRKGLGAGGAFLWIKNLAASDLPITALVTALALVSAWVAPSTAANNPHHTLMIFVQAAITVVVVTKLASGIALYWAASSVVGIGQSLWLRHVPE